MSRIIHNRARCKLCGDIIESTHRHDFVTCSCGNVSVDGGHDYIRRGWMGDRATWENMNEVEKYHWSPAFTTHDGHAWSLGVDLLHCPRTDTGDVVTLHARDKVDVDCTVYSIDAKLFDPDVPLREVFIAVGRCKGATVVFCDEDTFERVLYYINNRKGENQ